MLTCTKQYKDIPFAHRQHNHDGHCAWIHGHNWSIEFEFEASELDENGFVIDFGKLKFIKNWFAENVDHCLLLNESDPYRDFLTRVLASPEDLIQDDPHLPSVFANIYVVPDGSAEGLAQYFFRLFDHMVDIRTNGRVRIRRVTVHEDEKNSATYAPNVM